MAAAGRVNTKFVIALALVLVVVGGGASFVAVKMVHADPTREAAKGRAEAAAGNWDDARIHFERALAQRTDDANLILEYVHALEQIQPENLDKANQYLVKAQGFLNRAVDADPTNEKAYQTLMEHLISYSKLGLESEIWPEIYKRSEQMLSSNPEAKIARKYRGMAQVNRLENNAALKDREITQIETDLKGWLKDNKDDPDATYYLSIYYLLRAAKVAALTPDDAQVAVFQDQAKAMTAGALERNPDDIRRRIDHVAVLTDLSEVTPDTDEGKKTRKALRDEIAKLLERLEKDASEKSDDRDLVLRVADALQVGDLERVPTAKNILVPKGFIRAEKVLLAAKTRFPEDMQISYALAQSQYMQGRTDEALPLFKQLREMKVKGSALEFVRARSVRTLASYRYASLLLDTAEKSNDEKKRDAVFKEVDGIIDTLATDTGDTPYVNLLRGKLLRNRGQLREALKMLDRASTQFNARTGGRANTDALDALLLAADAAEQVNSTGMAVKYLQTVIALRPGYLPAQQRLVKLLLTLKLYDDARAQLDVMMKMYPKDLGTQELMAEYMIRTGNTAKAIEFYEGQDKADHPEVVAPLAYLYFLNKQPDKARSLLMTALERDHKNLDVIRVLLYIDGNTPDNQAILTRAEKEGADPALIQTYRIQLIKDPEKRIPEIETAIADREPDPIKRDLQLVRLYKESNNPEKAKAALAHVQTLPGAMDSPLVINSLFYEALEAGKFDEAKKLAEKGTSINSDLAKGYFLRGQLSLAQNKFDDAVRYFTDGLRENPVMADGWRLLGDAQSRVGGGQGAVDSYQKALTADPSNVAALRGLAQMRLKEGDGPAALEAWRRARLINPRDKYIFDQYAAFEEAYGDEKKALAVRDEYAKRNPADASNQRALAYLMARNGKGDEAMNIVDDLLAKSTTREDRRVNTATKGAIMAFLGKADQGRKLIREFIDATPTKDRVSEDWMMLARFDLTQADEDKALSEYRLAIEIEDKEKHPATREAADVLFEVQRFADAAGFYQTIWQPDRNDLRVGQRLAESQLRSRQVDESEKTLGRVKELIEQNEAKAREDAKKAGQSEVPPDTQAVLISQRQNYLVLAALITQIRGDNEKALGYLTQAAALDPNHPRTVIYLEMGEVLSLMNRDKDAIDALHKAIDLDPRGIPPRRLLADIYIRRNDLDQGIRELQFLLEKNPQYRPARVRLAEVFRTAGPGYSQSYETFLIESSKLFPGDPYWTLNLARAYKDEEKIPEAVQALQETVARAPTAENLIELIKFTLDLRDQIGKETAVKIAMAYLDQNKQVAAENPVMQALLGRAYIVRDVGDDRAKGETCLIKALSLANSFPAMILTAEQVQDAVGVEKGMAMIRSLGLQGPKAGWGELAQARMLVRANRFPEAVQRLQQSQLLIAPENQVDYEQLLSGSLNAAGQYEAARQSYERILKQDPSNIETLNNLAYLLAEHLNKPDDAVPYITRAAQAAPTHPQVLDTLGWVQFKKGDVENAIKTLERSIRSKSLPDSLYHYGVVLSTLGPSRRSDARAQLVAARDLADHNNDATIKAAAEKKIQELDAAAAAATPKK